MPDIPADPCNPSPCGSNAICRNRNGAGSCTCIQDYFGDPYINCRPECVQNSDCVSTKSCVNMKCVDPCIGLCGFNAECRVSNHIPVCTCISGFTGNPMRSCQEKPSSMIQSRKMQNVTRSNKASSVFLSLACVILFRYVFAYTA